MFGLQTLFGCRMQRQQEADGATGMQRKGWRKTKHSQLTEKKPPPLGWCGAVGRQDGVWGEGQVSFFQGRQKKQLERQWKDWDSSCKHPFQWRTTLIGAVSLLSGGEHPQVPLQIGCDFLWPQDIHLWKQDILSVMALMSNLLESLYLVKLIRICEAQYFLFEQHKKLNENRI